jgi:GT2 family glycosyltransferase
MMQAIQLPVSSDGNNCPKKVAVILTCFNRKQKTLDCLDAVLAQSVFSEVAVYFFVTDDGSQDGTSDALMHKYKNIRLLKGNGSLFWNGGMRMAWEEALKSPFDYFFLLNDDTFLYHSTLQRMLVAHEKCKEVTGKAGIIIGSTLGENGKTSYGGELQKSKLRPLTLIKLDPTDHVQPCDTFNGNCVLISQDAVLVLGNLDSGFVHAMGDTDYGLRAKRAGIPMWVIPFYAGRCVNDNSTAGSFNDSSLSAAARFKKILSPKGLPWRAWRIVCRRHAGILWPIYCVWPYAKIFLTSFWGKTERFQSHDK